MAPSTATPSNLRRAPAACLECRAAKVRCLLASQADRCDRCINNGYNDCVFTQPRRPRTRRPRNTNLRPRQAHSPETPAVGAGTEPDRIVQRRTITPAPTPLRSLGSAPVGSPVHISTPHRPPSQLEPPQLQALQPLVSGEIRARLVAALATLRGKKGAPFSFVTSGDVPAFSSAPPHEAATDIPARQQPQQSLKLSGLLKPIGSSLTDTRANSENADQNFSLVNMPSYVSSMTLGLTITDPVAGGIITYAASKALFDHFMLEINAKWEYILDPHEDTHDNVRRRSGFLYATILFCSSKFVSYANGRLSPKTDVFLQSRLCSLARSLAVKSLAEGNRSLEAMQSFYILACRKEHDDDVSYLHSGYAFRVLQDADLDQVDSHDPQVTRLWRTWLALFRQDKQQSLFFLKKAFFGSGGDDGMSSGGDFSAWLESSRALPLDPVASCCAALRRIQGKMRGMVYTASSAMLPSILDLMESELSRCKSTWQGHFDGSVVDTSSSDQILVDGKMLHPGASHITTLLTLYEQSIRLNVASAIFRQALIASAEAPSRPNGHNTTPLHLDLPSVVQMLATDVPGLRNSIEGAFGTLEQLLCFPTEDLRQSPDAVLLLGPSAALFLCLLLCLPCRGLLGPTFQKTAIGLIRDIASHVGQAVQSPQDIVCLHAAYLESLVQILSPVSRVLVSEGSRATTAQQNLGPVMPPEAHEQTQNDDSVLQAAHALTSGLVPSQDDTLRYMDTMFDLSAAPEDNVHMQSLVNLLDPDCWSVLPMGLD